jgi:hypothetical protein
MSYSSYHFDFCLPPACSLHASSLSYVCIFLVPYLFPCLHEAGVPHADLCLSPCPLLPPPCPSLQKIPRMTLASFFFFCTVLCGPSPDRLGFPQWGDLNAGGRGGGEGSRGPAPIHSSPSSLLQAVCLPGFAVPAGASRIALTLFFLQR